jgi:hypothetical protein
MMLLTKENNMTQNIAALPKWAQVEIARLTEEVERWKAMSEIGPDQSDTVVLTMDRHARAVRTPLGRGPRIVFTLDDGSDITIRNDGSRLDVNMNGSGEFSVLSVLPRQSNTVFLQPYSQSSY